MIEIKKTREDCTEIPCITMRFTCFTRHAEGFRLSAILDEGYGSERTMDWDYHQDSVIFIFEGEF
jgi:hypothetical protein